MHSKAYWGASQLQYRYQGRAIPNFPIHISFIELGSSQVKDEVKVWVLSMGLEGLSYCRVIQFCVGFSVFYLGKSLRKTFKNWSNPPEFLGGFIEKKTKSS